jgi:hypothetical protein
MAVTDPHVRDIDRRVDIQRHDDSLYERTGIAGWIVLILFVGGLSAIVYGATLSMNPATNPAASMAQMAPASPDTGASKGPASSP